MRMRKSVASPCDECGEDAFTGYQGLGWLCSEECFNTAKEKRDAFHDELRALKTEDFPDEFQLSDFERYALRIALDCVDDEETFEFIKKNHPHLTSIEDVAEEVKERTLNRIPGEYVEIEEARGHARMFTSGTYRVVKPIPKSVIIEAFGAPDEPGGEE